MRLLFVGVAEVLFGFYDYGAAVFIDDDNVLAEPGLPFKEFSLRLADGFAYVIKQFYLFLF